MTRAPMRAGVAATCVLLMALPPAAWAQAFPIVPPKLPLRSGAPAPQGQAQGSRPATAATGAPQQAQPTYGAQPYGAQPYGAQPAYQATHGQATHGQPAYGQPAYGQPAYGQPAHGQPQAQPGHAQQQPVAVAAAAPRAAAGPCRVLPSAERQALALVSGDPPLPREHVPLGEFRAQQVVHSPDGRWAVAFTKLRGAPQFAALTLDLERCGVQRTIELPAAGSDAEFHGDEALLRFAGGERRVTLRDGSVR